jgi:glycosyltransferase involved in cell wall biosynthesis
MALVALFLKLMFNVPAFFFMHTDWLDFAKHNTDLTVHERDRVRRLLRAFYKRFDGIFVLNDDHREWLAGREMEIDPERIHRTAHHAEPRVVGARPIHKRELFPDATDATPILFAACRLSREKGIFDLPDVLARARESLPDLRLVVAGDGPAAAELRAALPDARFVGWVDRNRLAELYLGLDLFVFPSRFDTFGNVLVEALTHGMPAVAYACKGPKHILEEGRSGYLVESTADMADRIVTHFREPWRHAAMRAGAERRAADYQAEPILRRFLEDLGLDASALAPRLRAANVADDRWALAKERSVA